MHESLRPLTLELLTALQKTVWFTNVGCPIEGEVVVLSSWTDAEAQCSSAQWEYAQLEARNTLSVQVFRLNRARHNMRSEIVSAIQTHIEPLVWAKTVEVVNNVANSKNLIDNVRWDLVGACLECEYSDVYDYRFYRSLSEWYLMGHFPCGWDGDYPEGRLVVF